MNTLLRISLLCAVLVSVAGSVGGIPPTAAQSAAYNDTMDSEATGLLSTESPDPAKVSFAYQDGTFVMQALDPAYDGEMLAGVLTPIMAGTQVMVDVSVSGDVNGKYVIVGCRAGPDNDGYQLEVNLDSGEASLRRMHREFPTGIASTDDPVALNPGAAMNQIGIECQDNRISAIVNGVTVLTVFDPTYTEGRSYIGVGSWLASSDGLTAVFDNLTVADLGGADFESADDHDQAPVPAGAAQSFSVPPFDVEAAYVQSALTAVLTPATAGLTGGSVDLAQNTAASVPFGVQLEEFYAELTFVTPQLATSGLWLYGFCFWVDAAGNCTDVFVQSDGASANWGLGSFPATGAYTLLDSGAVPAGAIDLTPGAENVIALVIYQGSAVLAVNGEVAASFHLTSQPAAGDLVERVEFSSDDPNAQLLTMTTHDVAVWDLSGVDLMVEFEEDAPAEGSETPDASSVIDRDCRLTQPEDPSNALCNEESLG